MHIQDNLLIKKILNPDKEVILGCKEIRLETCEQEIAVWWKRAWHRMNTKNIGDGVQILRVHQREMFDFDVDVDWVIKGMSLYKEFDEVSGTMKTYLYRFPKDRRDFLNSFLAHHTDAYQVVSEGKFIVLQGESSHQQTAEQYPQRIAQSLAFLFGIFLVYGHWAEKEGRITHARIQLPIVGSIASYLDYLSALKKTLTDEGVYTVVDILEQKYGQLWQMSIGDDELLSLFAKWLGYTASGNTPGRQTSLFERLGNEGDVEIHEQLEKGVLKLVRK